MRFDERWMGDGQTSKLGHLAAETAGITGEVVEIGTWQGWSAIPIGLAIRPSTLHVVDHWRGDGAAIPPELVARPNFEIFKANVEEAGLTPHVRIWMMDWREWMRHWNDQPIRFVHIDAAHTTTEVSDNIAALLPLMPPGSIMAGDDWDWPDVEAGIRPHFDADRINIMFNKLWWVHL